MKLGVSLYSFREYAKDENLGVKGFVAPDRLPVVGDDFHEGNICYHLRDGEHYFSRRDWLIYMNIIHEKRNKK